MRTVRAMAFVFLVANLLAPCHAWCEGARTESGVVQWSAHSDIEGGRRFLTDGNLLIETKYACNEIIPKKSVPPLGVQRLLGSATDHEFGLSDLDKKGINDHYIAPGPIQLHRKYVDCLKSSSSGTDFRFRAKGPIDPVLILNGDKVVGVVMPMKM